MMTKDRPQAPLPVAARVHLAHVVVQRLAFDVGVDLLHIKGPAVFPGLRDADRTSTDADVLVRPSHVPWLVKTLEAHGWERRSDFKTGSPFAHAATWWHDDWGWVDVHSSWPGARLPAEETFDVLASAGATHQIAHVDCPVPDRVAQRLILLLHSARSPSESDKPLAWDAAPPAEQAAVRALAARLDAEVALAAALGELDQHRGDRDHDLWRRFSEGGDRISEWRVRLGAARGTGARLRLLWDAARVNRDHLRGELGHEPSRADVLRRQLVRGRRLLAETRSRLGSRP